MIKLFNNKDSYMRALEQLESKNKLNYNKKDSKNIYNKSQRILENK